MTPLVQPPDTLVMKTSAESLWVLTSCLSESPLKFCGEVIDEGEVFMVSLRTASGRGGVDEPPEFSQVRNFLVLVLNAKLSTPGRFVVIDNSQVVHPPLMSQRKWEYFFLTRGIKFPSLSDFPPTFPESSSGAFITTRIDSIQRREIHIQLPLCCLFHIWAPFCTRCLLFLNLLHFQGLACDSDCHHVRMV